MASPISPITSSSAASSASAAASAIAGSSAPNEQMFLQLLVAQLQNQDPLNPTDGTQFVSELAQFSELEQVIAIRSDIESQMQTSAASSASNNQTQTTSGTGQV
jgi:flagellar basal-body rod modification protein FlgD